MTRRSFLAAMSAFCVVGRSNPVTTGVGRVPLAEEPYTETRHVTGLENDWTFEVRRAMDSGDFDIAMQQSIDFGESYLQQTEQGCDLEIKFHADYHGVWKKLRGMGYMV